ncbi:virion core cysteine protease [Salmon gill poxvirus]|uniref:Virion core cysteine protease n=1 Tax=Salmon gill poxvirus TaxID=1680908 RepID=A0A0H4Y191_9POXV|nr:virion core cysteine protease [Salmon gill poxvirus]AKR04275.1 virion core cysteine protease [Salmon gill poxvirus]
MASGKKVGSFRTTNNPETTVGLALLKIDSVVQDIPVLNHSLYSTNCNNIFINRAKQVKSHSTCLPESELFGIWSQLYYGKERPPNFVELLDHKIKDMTTLALLKHTQGYPLDYYYKPPILTQPSYPFDYRKGVSSKFGFELLGNSSRSPELSGDPQVFAWMKMSELERIMITTCLNTPFTYIGYFITNQEFTADCNARVLITEQFGVSWKREFQNPKTQFISWICGNNGHWTTGIYSKVHKILFYFDSQINDTDKIARKPKIAVYSYDTCSLDKLPGGTLSEIHNPDTLSIEISYLVTEAFDPSMKIMICNKETAQLYSAECGMYSLVFQHLMMTHVLSDGNEVLSRSPKEMCKVYHFFKYCGDMGIREYRKMFYNTDPFSIIENPSSSIEDFNTTEKLTLETLENIVTAVKNKMSK